MTTTTWRTKTGLGRRACSLAAILLLAGCAFADGATDEDSSSEGPELAVKAWTKVCSAKRARGSFPPRFIPGGSKVLITTTWDHGGMDFSTDGTPCELQFY